MEEIVKIKDKETEYDYIKRIVYGKLDNKTIDKDYVELAPLIFKQNLSSSECRKRMYGVKFLLKILDKEKINNINDNELLNELKEKIQELKKEKIKFQDQKREYRKLLRLDARWENLKDNIIQEVKNLDNIKLLKNDNLNINNYKNKEKEACLILSDWHTGLEVNNYWNVFNSKVLKERVNILLSKTIQYCINNNVNILHIEILGDMVMGLIHITSKIFSEEDTIKQIKIVSELLAEFLYELSKYISNIKVYTTSGNHGRCTPNKKEEIDTENFENLINWYLQARLHNINNIKFVSNKYDDEIIVYKIFNETIFSVHGHRESLNKVVDNLSQMLKIFPTEIHMGHFHKDYQTEQHDISIIVNGCLSGVDQYAKSKRLTNKPHQKLIIYNQEGQECIYKIKL